MNINQSFKKIGFSAVLLVAGVLLGVSVKSALADATRNGSGFAWSGGVSTSPAGYDGMGWISFNNASDGSAVNYGVNIPENDGVLSGQAWSEHYGWISFDSADLAGCPSGACIAGRVGNALVGWARILSIKDAVVAGNAGGFDGWVSLSGTAANGASYGIAVTGTSLGGYAWSSDLGAIQFDRSPSYPFAAQSDPVTYASANILQICQDGVPVVRGGSPAFTAAALGYGSHTALTAYFDTTPDCAGADVTALTRWTDTASNIVTISPSGSNPEVVTAGAADGNENVIAEYPVGSGNAATVNFPVHCIAAAWDCSSALANTCAGATTPSGSSVVDSCGVSHDCSGQSGTKVCGSGSWKEVAP